MTMDSLISMLIDLNNTPSILISLYALYVLRKYINKRSKTTTKNDETLHHGYSKPPLAPGGYLHVARNFRTKQSPMYYLNTLHSVGSKIVSFSPFPGKMATLVGDATVARQILNDPKAQKYQPAYAFINKTAGGDTFFATATVDAHRFKHVKKSTSVAFARQHIQQRMASIMDKTLDEWIKLHFSTLDSKTLDISNEMQKLTIQVISRAAFDYSLTNDEIETMLSCLKLTTIEYSQKARNNILRSWMPWFFPQAMKAMQASEKIRSLCRVILESHRSRRRAHQDSPLEEDEKNEATTTLLDCIVQDSEYASDNERICDMIVYFFAGFDTTGHTIAFALLELARNPSLQTWVRNELEQQETTTTIPNALKYTIRETMRLHPTAPIIGLRVLDRDLTMPQYKFWLPKKSIVFFSSYVLGRDAEVFGKETVNIFDPKRWEGDGDERLKKMNQYWLAFGSGKRACQGQPLANLEMAVVLSKLLKSFTWEVIQEGQTEYYVTLKTVGTLLKATKIGKQ